MYIAFKCIQCNHVVIYPERTSDGHRCNKCNGMLKPFDKGTKEELIKRWPQCTPGLKI